MARKKKNTIADNIVHLGAKLPWWLAVLLAVAAFFLLHGLASAPIKVTSAKPDDMAGQVLGQFVRSAAMVGQILLPLLLLIGALSSLFAQRLREKLIAGVHVGDQEQALRTLRAMSWQEFELVIGQYFRTRGYGVTEHGGAGPDGGIDLALSKGGERYLVQCKQWRATKVGVAVVRELYGVMAAEGATGGYVISVGAFSADAQEFARGRNIALLDGPLLARIMRDTAPARQPAGPGHSADSAVPAQLGPPAIKACPVCGNRMVMRTAQRGRNAGKRFWGCSGFPACRGTLAI